MSDSHLRRLGRLSVSFFLVVMVSSVAALAVTTLIELRYGRREAVQRIEANVSFVQESYLPSISAGLYVIDYTQLELLLQGVIRLEGIVRCEVVEGENLSVGGLVAGRAEGPSDDRRVFPLSYAVPGGAPLPLGELILTVDYSASRATVQKHALRQLRNTTFPVFLVSALVMFLFQRMVARHLADLASFTQQMDLANLDVAFRLRRPARSDELSQVAEAINSLRERLRQGLAQRDEAELALARHRDHLEQLVLERTRALEATQEELVKRERLALLGQLTATVSHELRNPLGTVANSVFTIREALASGDQERLQRSLGLADRNIRRANRIIVELLDFSRHPEMNWQDTEMDPWVRATVQDLGIPDDVQVQWRLESDAVVPVDRGRLQRVLINVVSNASQAMDGRSEKRLIVGTRRAEDRLLVSVADTGCGMGPEVLARIFEPLFSTKSFGVGLGMTVVKNSVEDHGGGVEVTSEPQRGTQVTLWLPLRRP